MTNWKCWFRHKWDHHMETLRPVTFYAPVNDIVFGWKQCERCGANRVTLVLQ